MQKITNKKCASYNSVRILSSFNEQMIHKYKVTAKFDGSRNVYTKVNNRGGMSLRFSMLQQKSH